MIKIRKLIKNEPLKIAVGALLFVPGFIFSGINPTFSVICFVLSLVVTGFSVYLGAFRGILRRDFLDEKFLMSIASTGAMIIGECAEGAAVMLFFLIGEYFEHRAVGKSRKTIKSLLDICPDSTSVLIDGEEREVDAEDVSVGDLILLRPGDRVPIDCRVVFGNADIDTSMLTGESIPVAVGVGDELHSGTVVQGGSLRCECIRVSEESCAARILDLVENATERKSKEENFITVFSRYYTPIVTALAILMVVIPTAFGILLFKDALYRALSFLVVSCPCALVISVPMAFFGGIGGAAHLGILYKGGSVFAPLSKAQIAVFDKTGTLTNGKFRISSVSPKGISEEDLLSLVASVERYSKHPIAECLSKGTDRIFEVTDFAEISGKGVRANIDNSVVFVGNFGFIKENSDIDLTEDLPGRIYAARDGFFIGYITVSDEVKTEADSALRELRRYGINKTVMLTGDKAHAGNAVGDALGFDKVYTELLPEDKFNVLEGIIDNSRGRVGYVGDGINDSPCLRRADVGIAMGKLGSDAAIEAADAVIMSDDLSKIVKAIKIARKTVRIAKENIIFAISVKLLVLLLVSLNLSGMWMAVFADVGVAVLAILNSMRTLLVNRLK